MASFLNEVFILNDVEFATLLSGKGVKQIYTLSNGQKIIEPEDVCFAMNHLYQTGLISSADGTFSIIESLDVFLDNIKNAERILLMQNGCSGYSTICYYICGEKIVAVQVSNLDKGLLKIYEVEPENLIIKLEEFLNEQKEYAPILDEEEEYNKVLMSQVSTDIREIRRQRNILFTLEEIDIYTGHVNKRIIRRLLPDGEIINYRVKGKSLLYNKNDLVELVMDILAESIQTLKGEGL